jgi:hypothetical protein
MTAFSSSSRISAGELEVEGKTTKGKALTQKLEALLKAMVERSRQ